MTRRQLAPSQFLPISASQCALEMKQTLEDRTQQLTTPDRSLTTSRPTNLGMSPSEREAAENDCGGRAFIGTTNLASEVVMFS